MLFVLVSIIAFTLFIAVLGFAFILKNKKNKVSCSGGCSACKHQQTENK